MSNTDMMDMTHGPLLGNILRFSLPLMASNILQLLFNAADTVVVGRFAGYTSLAAMSSSMPVITLVTNLLIGLAIGVNVTIARYIGIGNHDKDISRTLHTSVVVALVAGVIMGAVGILASDWLLAIIAVPDDVFDLAKTYMCIYFIGTPFSMLYNYCAAALRAMGDTKRPMIFLVISGIVNVFLNLFMVIVLGMAVGGVAIATVLSQLLSAILVVRHMSKISGPLHFSWKKICFDKRAFKDIMYIGLPSGLQSCMFSISNIAIQSAINSYGSIAIAAIGAASSIEGFIVMAMNAFQQASQTFISQNKGAGKYDRIGKVLRICLLCTFTVGFCMGLVISIFGEQFIGIYNSDPEVIAMGATRLRRVASVYFLFGLEDALVGAIRGYGVPILPVVINLLGTCVFRVIWVALLDTPTVAIEMVYLSYPISWILTLIALIIVWKVLRHRERKTLAAAQT